MAVAGAACSGGDGPDGTGDAATSPPDTTAADPTATTVRSMPDGDVTGVEIDPAALEGPLPDVVDADAELRCERLGYTCSWSDLDEATLETTLAVAAEVQDLIDAERDPSVGLTRALERLATEPVVELIVDREGFTGMLYRLEGTPELFATTGLGGPLGDEVTLDLTELDAELAELEALPSEGAPAVQGFAGTLPERYHPTGGPRNPKRGLVLDPYATQATECPAGAPPNGCFADPGDGRIEGSTIYATMSAHPQISATYRAGSDVGPWALDDLGTYDLVHIASHGTSGCADRNAGWTAGVTIVGDEDEQAFVEQVQSAFRSTTLDPNRCYSITVLGKFDMAKYKAWGKRIPPGIGMNGHAWAVMPDFLVGKFKPEAIVYISNCTSADGQLFSSGRYGSFVGWHSYARTTVAYEAAIEFWRLMVVEGVEFDVATEWLDDKGLDWSVTGQAQGRLGEWFVPEHISIGASGAFMATAGKNQRARDVITVTLDGGDIAGRTLRVHGLPGDTKPETFPAEGQQLVFEIEGVKDGTAGSVVLEVYADGTKLRHDLQLERHGTRVDEDGDAEWSTWRVTVPEGAIELPDTTAADFAPGATPIDLEVRAFEDASEYTADGGKVTLGARLASNGPLPIFGELAAGMPAGGDVTGNDLEIEFDTAGGEVEGHMRVEMVGYGRVLGFWEFDLTGSYDPATGSISGDMTGVSQGGYGGITAGDSGSGTWQGTVDLGAHSLAATLGIGGQSQSYQGTLRPASTG